jgi:7-carboxy-7-deazaguanine synthase
VNTPKTLPIHERFFTWQGEGVHMGRAAFFIRTFGCPVHCKFCDSAGTWHPNWVPKHVNRMTPQQITDEVCEVGNSIVVVTGGEPAIHDLAELTTLLHLNNRKVHLETSGAYDIRGNFDWITVSPKRDRPPLPHVIAEADEFKFIIEHPDDILFWWDYIRAHRYNTNAMVPIWLHPEWSKREDVRGVLDPITNFVKQHGDPFRAGWQLHKVYRSDALDNRAAPLVPLGGDPAKGL